MKTQPARSFKSSLFIALFACLALGATGCLKTGDDQASTEPIDDGSGGGGGGGGGAPAPTCDYAGSSSGFFADGFGGFINGLTAGSTVSGATFYFSGASIANHTITIEAYECGFQGALRGTANAAITNMQTGSSHKPAVFTFGSPITIANCGGGTGGLAFKFSVNSGPSTTAQLGFATQHVSGTSCTVKVSADVTSATPSQQSTWMMTGSIVSP